MAPTAKPSNRDPIDRASVYVPADRSWFDPRLITRVTKVEAEFVTLPAAQTVVVAKNNPSRVRLLVLPSAIPAVNLCIAPHNQPALWPFRVMTIGNPLDISLFEYQSLVTGEWYANEAGGTTVFVIQVVREG